MRKILFLGDFVKYNWVLLRPMGFNEIIYGFLKFKAERLRRIKATLTSNQLVNNSTPG